ncbi:hypothetical protein ABLT80_10400 [Acinetobacter schindleri]|uniref:hypothetical protein n=1 Tax=Acinetobacter schindleri TaxID=108981 RepID=UPI00289B2922|nr:hypothetical protein [Acinetobacter schindleri]
MKNYIWAAGIALFLAFSSYIYQFYMVLGFPLSKDQAVWGQLGDFIGGLLNPLFGFISIILLIKSLSLQNQSNRKLIEQIENTKRTESLKSFENLFFNLIDVKNGYFSHFLVELNLSASETRTFAKDIAVDKLEIIIQKFRENSYTDEQIKIYLDEINNKNNIFSQIRCFYVIVKLIDEHLSDINGFTQEERKKYYRLLVNFTEFAHIRLIIMSMQFLDFESTRYLNNHTDFQSILNDLNLLLNPY